VSSTKMGSRYHGLRSDELKASRFHKSKERREAEKEGKGGHASRKTSSAGKIVIRIISRGKAAFAYALSKRVTVPPSGKTLVDRITQQPVIERTIPSVWRKMYIGQRSFRFRRQWEGDLKYRNLACDHRGRSRSKQKAGPLKTHPRRRKKSLLVGKSCKTDLKTIQRRPLQAIIPTSPESTSIE